MRKNLLRKGKVGGHEQGRPVDRVCGDDVLAHDVQACGPPGIPLIRKTRLVGARIGVQETRSGDVVDERVHPHVADVIGIERECYTPRKT